MAIEIDIPIEIEDYQEKIIFGMSLRQLSCFSAAVALGIGTYFLCTKAMGMTMDSASYVIIFEALPLMAFGFIRKDGQPFEKYFALIVRHQIGNKKLPFTVKLAQLEDAPDGKMKSKYAWVFEKENSGTGKPILTKRERKAEAALKEAFIIQADDTSRKRKRAIVKAKIEVARNEYRALIRRDNEENRAVKQQFSLFLRPQTGNKQLPYVVQLMPYEDKTEERKTRHVWIFEKEKSGTSNAVRAERKRRTDTGIREAAICQTDKKSHDRARKKARAKIKIVQQEYKALIRRDNEENRAVEQQFSLFLRPQTGNKQLPYVVQLMPYEDETEERKTSRVWIFEKEKSGTSNAVCAGRERRTDAGIREAVICQTDKKSRERARKKARAKIKIAQQEYRTAKRRAEEKSEVRDRA